jgi:hypothetical protein
VCLLQGGLTWLWLDAPYVITARKLFNWAVEANNNGDVFPVSTPTSTRDPLCAFCSLLGGNASLKEAAPSVRGWL